MKLPKKGDPVIILLALVVLLCLYLVYQKVDNTSEFIEGFADELKTADEIENELTRKYSSNLAGKSSDELKDIATRLRLRMNKYGLYPSGESPDLSKYALKPSSITD